MKKLYCYVDESGQDTRGAFFLVALVLVDQDSQPTIEQRLVALEQETGKEQRKWTNTGFATRQQFLTKLPIIRELRGCLYYGVYHATKEYTALTALTIAKAVLTQASEAYEVSIIIDGLSKAETDKVRRELKSLKISYRGIRRMKEQQSTFLRLADCLAGFLRDAQEQRPYATALLARYQQAKLLIEV